MEHEFVENRKIKQYLDLSHKAADAYANMEWSDAPIEQIRTEIGERRYVQDGMRLDPTVAEVDSDGPSPDNSNDAKNKDKGSARSKKGSNDKEA